MDGRLARTVNYFLSCVNYFGDHLNLELGMLEKFPITGCLYCGSLPCECSESRPDPVEYFIHNEQKQWTIRQWQEHLQNVYGHFNVGKFEKVFMRFVSEAGEFGILHAEGPDTPIYPDDLMKEFRREAADVFSWILTLAYVENVDLEKAIVDRYETCPGCNKSVDCACPNVFISNSGTMFSRVGTDQYIKKGI
jgi:NTP pyrophosphatase (non-canonical NTP hydrolase)